MKIKWKFNNFNSFSILPLMDRLYFVQKVKLIFLNINNQQISNHQSIIFGLRELTSIEFDEICLQNSTKNFSIYLDENNNWQSDV